MAPAHQRLEPDDGAGVEVDEWLVMNLQLLQSQCLAKHALDLHAVLELLVHDRIEDLHVIAAPILGLIHRHIGMLEQFDHVGTVAGIDTDAEAR